MVLTPPIVQYHFFHLKLLISSILPVYALYSMVIGISMLIKGVDMPFRLTIQAFAGGAGSRACC